MIFSRPFFKYYVSSLVLQGHLVIWIINNLVFQHETSELLKNGQAKSLIVVPPMHETHTNSVSNTQVLWLMSWLCCQQDFFKFFKLQEERKKERRESLFTTYLQLQSWLIYTIMLLWPPKHDQCLKLSSWFKCPMTGRGPDMSWRQIGKSSP